MKAEPSEDRVVCMSLLDLRACGSALRSEVNMLKLKEFFGCCSLLGVPELVEKGEMETDLLGHRLPVLNPCDLTYMSN